MLKKTQNTKGTQEALVIEGKQRQQKRSNAVKTGSLAPSQCSEGLTRTKALHYAVKILKNTRRS